MSKSTALVSVIIVLLIIFGVYWWAKNPQTSVPTTGEEETTGTTPTGGETRSVAPVVSTRGATSISQSTAVLNGEVNPKGAQTSYWYEYGETDSLGSSTSYQLVGSGFATLNAPGVLIGLKSNTTYYYRIGAQNQNGKTYGAVLSFKTALSTPPGQHLLPTVSTARAEDITTTKAMINGTVNPRGSETRYWFEYGETFGLGNTTSSVSAGDGSANVSVSANLRGLEQNQIYYYRLNAQNTYGTVNGNIEVFKTRAENPPAGEAPDVGTTSATNVGRTTATLNGQVDSNGSATTYHFEYGRSTLFGIFLLDQSTDEREVGSGTSMVDVNRNVTGLEPDATYYFQLVAKNQFGTTRGAIWSFTTNE